MQHSSFDLRDFLSGALSRSKANGGESTRKVDMHCEGCGAKFPFYKRKKQCAECHLLYCSNCLSPPNGVNVPSSTSVLSRIIDKNLQYCPKCHVLLARPLCRADLQKLRAKDLQHYLTAHHVSIKGCVEKEDLVNLLIRYVGSTGSYNDLRQAGTFRAQPTSPDEHATGGYSNQPMSRRSSVPNLPSPTDAPPPNAAYPHSTSQTAQSTSQARSTPASPEVTSPSGGSPTNAANEGMPFEELTDWEVLPGAADMGPVPIVSEVDDVPTQQPPPQSNTHPDISIDEIVDEILSAPPPETSSAQASPAQTPKMLMLSSIKTLDDLEQLSIKQLKELLVRNRVDFRGCVEKAELIERATRLWSESLDARKDLDNLSMDELCKICMDAPVECVMLECGHMATCTACGKQLNECPICRQYVVRVVRIFKA